MSTGGGLTPGTDSRFGSYSIAELAAAADEAHRLGKRITCHAHGVPGIDNASKAGHRLDPALHDARPELGVDLRRGRSRAAWSSAGRGRSRRSRPGTRYEVETGKDINKLQPNPGKMTRADIVCQRSGAVRRGRDDHPGHRRRHQLHRFRRGPVPRARGVGRDRPGPGRGHPAAPPGAPRGTSGSRARPGRCGPASQADVLIVTASPTARSPTCGGPSSCCRAGQRIQPTPPRPKPVRGSDGIPA